MHGRSILYFSGYMYNCKSQMYLIFCWIYNPVETLFWIFVWINFVNFIHHRYNKLERFRTMRQKKKRSVCSHSLLDLVYLTATHRLLFSLQYIYICHIFSKGNIYRYCIRVSFPFDRCVPRRRGLPIIYTYILLF